MVRSGFCEYQEEKLFFPACCRQKNAIFSPHTHGTQSAPYSPALYVGNFYSCSVTALTSPSGQQPWTEDWQSQPSPFRPCAALVLSGQHPNSVSMQQPSSLDPCAGTLLSEQHPYEVFLQGGNSSSVTSTTLIA